MITPNCPAGNLGRRRIGVKSRSTARLLGADNDDGAGAEDQPKLGIAPDVARLYYYSVAYRNAPCDSAELCSADNETV